MKLTTDEDWRKEKRDSLDRGEMSTRDLANALDGALLRLDEMDAAWRVATIKQDGIVCNLIDAEAKTKELDAALKAERELADALAVSLSEHTRAGVVIACNCEVTLARHAEARRKT